MFGCSSLLRLSSSKRRTFSIASCKLAILPSIRLFECSVYLEAVEIFKARNFQNILVTWFLQTWRVRRSAHAINRWRQFFLWNSTSTNQFAIFNPWKVPWNWMAFYQNSFVISPGLLYHLIRRDMGDLQLWGRGCSGLKITNCNIILATKVQDICFVFTTIYIIVL